MNKRTSFLAATICMAFLAVASSFTPASLRCEYLEIPCQIDAEKPRFSWINVPDGNCFNATQWAYEIKITDHYRKTVVWNSGRIISSQSVLIPYDGPRLKPFTRYDWQVRTWDNRRKSSAWSKTAFFITGAFSPSQWKCQWIGAPWQTDEPSLYSGQDFPAPLLRKTFSATKKVKSAFFFGTGLGYFELYINGNRVGVDVLCPNQTNYDRRPNLKNGFIPLDDAFSEYRIPYIGHDITHLLTKGENAVGVILGNGFYNSRHPQGQRRMTEPYGAPRFFGQIIITYSDNSTQTICSDTTWRAAKSAILCDGPFMGDVFDARLRHNGWAKTKFNDKSWQKAALRAAPQAVLFAQNGPPDRITADISPTLIHNLPNGDKEVVFPHEISGWICLRNINMNRGDSISIRYVSEVEQGSHIYISGGGRNEQYAPRFTWFAFNTAIISGWHGELTNDNICAQSVGSNVAVSGHFSCSNELFNTINDCFARSQLCNMHGSIASDCPHRERTAYTGDGQVACASAMANLDAAAFYNKWIADIRGSQIDSSGFVPNSAPWQPTAGGGIPWGAAICIMPWEFYLNYGDTSILSENFTAMCKYVRFMERFTFNGIMERRDSCLWLTLGEWCSPDDKFPPKSLVHTWYLWKCALITSKVAKILGRAEEEKYFGKLAQDTQDAFHRHFYDEQTGSYGDCGENVFALAMGVPEERLPRVIASLKNIIEKNGGHLHTGIYGTSLFFSTLAKYGLSELAYQAMNKTDYPGFGYWIKQGATTTWEQWDGKNSHNHPMFGGGLTWFYQDLAGVRLCEDGPGGKHVLIKPIIPEDLSYASYSKITPYGLLSSRWELVPEGILFSITIPVGANATCILPGKNISILKGEKHIPEPESHNGEIILSLPQGSFRFIVN